MDETGEQLLKHARVYTLAEKFGVEKLRTLASSKIHCVNSTAKGEITYARYVYQYTRKDDTAVRAPVANFWATRSHTLRAEAEEEFRGLCLEFPQFGYDVLSKFARLRRLPRWWWWWWWDLVTDAPLQPASWTKSSSESETTSCIRHPAVRASVPDTAKFDLANLLYYNSLSPFYTWLGASLGMEFLEYLPKLKSVMHTSIRAARWRLGRREKFQLLSIISGI